MDFYSVALIGLPTIALMMLSEHMARVRNRSVKSWVSICAIFGPFPLVPLALYLLGTRKSQA